MSYGCWNGAKFLTIDDHNGTWRYRIHRVKGENTPPGRDQRGCPIPTPIPPTPTPPYPTPTTLLTLSYRLNYKQAKYQTDWGILGCAMDVGTEQSCNFLLYTIIMERQETAYIELRVKLHHTDGLTRVTLPNLLQTTFRIDSGTLGWAMDAGMKQICISFYTITVERQVTAYIDLRVKLHHGDGLTEGDTPPPPPPPNSFLFPKLYPNQVSRVELYML